MNDFFVRLFFMQRYFVPFLFTQILALPCLGYSLTPDLARTGQEPNSARAPRTSWSVDVEGVETSLRIRTVSVMPGETVHFTANRPFSVTGVTAGSVESRSRYQSEWTAPDLPGLYSFELVPEDDDEVIERVRVNAFVLVPATEMKNGRLHGFRMGRYRHGEGAYARPEGFIQVTHENEETWVSPHFQLKQFVCKQAGGYPKFMRLSEALLSKLEGILDLLEARGIHANTLKILSGYRTPAHNHRLGRPASRHLYGDAADILVDNNGDGRMDDLNGDGKSNSRDARFLASIVDELETDHLLPVGGMGTYGSTRFHGPFIHVDARGFSARWARRL